MAKVQNTALDEIQFRRPDVLAYWQGVHADSVHGYIRESPFFDHTSKNGLLWDQAQFDGRVFDVCKTRATFEARLRSMNGLEYMIVGEAQPSLDPALGPDTGVWVVRKQDRRKRAGKDDELTVLGTYYIVGENMYQAPSVYDIVGNHLLSAMNSLDKFMSRASPLPIFTPAIGYSYYPPAPAKTAARPSQVEHSRESSVGPTIQKVPQNAQDFSTRATSPSRQSNQTAAASYDPRDSLALEQSFRMMISHGDEFMDENPLRGEPGKFVYTHTKDRLRARQAEADAVAAKAREKETAVKASSPAPAAFSTTPEKIKAESPEVKQPARKGSKGESRAKRRKSRAAISPTTPNTSSPASGLSPS